MLDFPNVLHEYFCQSVNPNTGELVHEATNVQQSCAVMDPNDGDIMMLQEMFEHRLHYHIVFKAIVVDSTWFSSRREYLACIMHNLEGMIIHLEHLTGTWNSYHCTLYSTQIHGESCPGSPQRHHAFKPLDCR